ncbi:MAG TPA: PaaI family thioesterase [Saprospiraceae bacterium]|jgi:acyl-CoA thioesterase|nr:PaaI family thioesterase [Saprospiraceae bacterium]HQW94359.1 PaaI family thioesterase [Saprospiraceae bacterium]
MDNWSKEKAIDIITKQMLSNDGFSKWLDIHIDLINEESIELSCLVTQTMTNGFQIAHGGIAFSLCDSALAFHSNSWGYKAVTIESSINFFAPVYKNDTIFAKTSILKLGKSLGHFLISTSNQNGKKVAVMKGMVFYSGESWN